MIRLIALWRLREIYEEVEPHEIKDTIDVLIEEGTLERFLGADGAWRYRLSLAARRRYEAEKARRR